MSRQPLVRSLAPLVAIALCLGSAPAAGQESAAGTPKEGSLDACIAAHESGQEKRLAGRLLDARKALSQCAAKQCPREIATQCTQWLMELRGEIPSVVLVVRDQQGRDRSDARVLLDGKDLGRGWVGASLEVDPGKHELRVEYGKGASVDRDFVATPGERRRRVTVKVPGLALGRRAPEKPLASDQPYLGYALLGVGAVALGASAVLWLSAKSDLDGFKEDCSPACDPADVDAAERKALFSDIALAVGVVSAASGSYLVISHGSGTPGDRGFRVSATGRF